MDDRFKNRRFGNWLKGARQQAGVSLEDLSKILRKDYTDGGLSLRELGGLSEIDYTMLNKVERGERFLSNEKILRLARIFDEDPQRLIAIQNQDREDHAAQKPLKSIPGFRPVIEAEVLRFLRIYRQQKNLKRIDYPLDLNDFFQTVFGLHTRSASFLKKGWSDPEGESILAALLVREKTIYINKDPDKNGIPFPAENRRFSQAHEGSHFILCAKQRERPTRPIFFRSKALLTEEERTVNYWAGAILMPKEALTSKIERLTEEKVKSVPVDLAKHGKALCDEFGVSRQALEIRLKQIGVKNNNGIYTNE